MNYPRSPAKTSGIFDKLRGIKNSVSRIQYPESSIQNKNKNNRLIFSYSILGSPVNTSGIFDKLRGIKS
jgi:hypothetical protein